MRLLPIRTVVFVVGLVVATQAAMGVTVNIAPSKDNTLYESGNGGLSNGAGDYLFVGRVAFGDLRRATIHFDIAGNIPAGATINSATLTMNMSRTIVGPYDATLHLAAADWGEGASDAGGQEGGGGPSAPGDATWIHTFYDTDFWATAGGDFVAGPSATTSIDQNGPYTWGSTAGMVADVQSWLDDPGNNFGWIVLGDESTAPLPTAKRFDSRENPNSPVLNVTFTEAGPPPEGVPTVSEWGLILMLLLLATAGTILFGQRRAVLAGAGEGFLSQGTVRPPLAVGLFLKTLAAVTGAAMLTFATAFVLFGEVTSVDLTGAMLCVPVLAYLIHLWLLPRKE